MTYTGSGIYAPNEGPVDVGRILDIIHTPQGDGALVMLDHQTGKDDALKHIRAGAPDAIIQVRRYVPNWTLESPINCAARFIELMTAVRPYTDHGTWANEQNLALESGGSIGAADNRLITWDEWQAIAAYNYLVASTVRRDAPWIVLHYPGVAYGHGEDWPYDEHHNLLPGFTPTSFAYDLMRPGIDLCHILNVHPYVKPGAIVSDEWNGLGRMSKVKSLFPGKTLFAAETGTFDVQNPRAPDRILDIAYTLQGDPAFLGYCFFILDSPDPAHAQNNWSLNRNIEAAYARMVRTRRPREWTEPAVPTTPPTPAPEPKPEPEMPPFVPNGRAWWVWYIDQCGGVQGIIDACQRTNVSQVYIKGGDGPSLWGQLTHDVVDSLLAAGIETYVWHYAYLGYTPGTSHGNSWTVDDEIECVKDMLTQAGPNITGFIADVEAETEGRPDQATAYAEGVRAFLGDMFFAYAPLPVIDYHTALPYVQFNAHVDAVMPQFYSNNLDGDPPWTYTRLMEQWQRWGATWANSGQASPPLMPAGEAYGAADAASIGVFESLASADMWPSWSYWSLQHAIQEGHIDTIANIASQEMDDVAIKLLPADKQELEAIFADMWRDAERAHAILAAYGATGERVGYWAENGLKSSVSQAKEPLGLNG